jgi:hypothetical protein
MPAVDRTRWIAALLLVALWTFAPAAARPVAAASCGAWSTSFAAPPTIRVLRVATGTVDTVPFQNYVGTVMAAEWPASYATEALRAGAVAVKQYAWYRAMGPRVSAAGDCYDVRDDSWDQVYDPSRVPAASQVGAIADTWPLTIRKSGAFFMVHYDGGTSTTCGGQLSSTGTWLYQRGVQACAVAGKSMAEILHVYLDPGLTISNAGRLGGADRYEVAANISQATFPSGAPVAYLANGYAYADALAGSVAATGAGGPILLVSSGGVPDVTAAELARLKPAKLVALGGPASVPDAVMVKASAAIP